MIQEIKLEENIIVLDSDKLYSGSDNPSDEEKLIRKAIGLPIKKQLIYYKDKKDRDTAINIIKYQITEMYDISEKWYTVELTLSDDTKVKTHSGYLIEMQKPNFTVDMAAIV